MQKRAKATQLREQRDEALFNAYQRALTEQTFTSQKEIYDWVRLHEAPRFFIAPEFCEIVIGRMLRGVPTGVRGEANIRKFNELYRRFLERRADPKQEAKDTRSICNIIVNEPAPEFYLSSYRTLVCISSQREKQCQYILRKWVR